MWEKIGEQPRRTEYFTILSILRKRQTKQEKKSLHGYHWEHNEQAYPFEEPVAFSQFISSFKWFFSFHLSSFPS